ncbi:MAG: hypothetical protein JXA18_01130 [Chitinispirillaceae bacterium]|nr:hypothetical protein [Chitinispirillaceae bacterium]
MADQKDLETLRPQLDLFKPKEVRYPDMPVDQALKEAEIMSAASIEDAEKFAAIGLDREKLDELSLAIGVLRLAQAQLTAALGELKEAARQWADEEPAAYDLRAEMLAAATYALRDIPDAVKALKKVREGAGKSDMLCDLKALAELGRKYKQHFEAIRFDTGTFDIAAIKADELSSLYAKAFIEKNTSGARDVRDRAFTYMRTLMGEVLDAAEYIFRKDKSRLEYYYSTYRSKQRTSPKTEPAEEEAAVTVEAPAEVPAEEPAA